MKHQTFSSEETNELGRVFAKELLKKVTTGKSAIFVGLFGELGSGKTSFVQGFMRGCGIRHRGKSPTFVIYRRYSVRSQKIKTLFHVDAYRIKKGSELLKLGLREFVRDDTCVVVVEWAERIKTFLPRGAYRISFSYGKKSHERNIVISRGK